MVKKIANLSGELAEDYLYEFITSHEGLSIYELAKLVGWSTGKVYHIVKALEDDGLVRTEKIEEGGRLKKKVYPVDWEQLLPKDVKSKLLAKNEEREGEHVTTGRQVSMTITA